MVIALCDVRVKIDRRLVTRLGRVIVTMILFRPQCARTSFGVGDAVIVITEFVRLMHMHLV